MTTRKPSDTHSSDRLPDEAGLARVYRAAPDVAPSASLDARILAEARRAVDARAFSLPALTLVLAGMDAFNPCAFFVLLFLLSLLVHARSRTRMAIIGGGFAPGYWNASSNDAARLLSCPPEPLLETASWGGSAGAFGEALFVR